MSVVPVSSLGVANTTLVDTCMLFRLIVKLPVAKPPAEDQGMEEGMENLGL